VQSGFVIAGETKKDGCRDGGGRLELRIKRWRVRGLAGLGKYFQVL